MEHAPGEDPILGYAIARCQRPHEQVGVVVVAIEADALGVEADVHHVVMLVAGDRAGVVVGESLTAVRHRCDPLVGDPVVIPVC